MRLNRFCKELVNLVALVACIQIVVIIFGDVLHINGHTARVWNRCYAFFMVKADGQFEGVRPPVKKLVGESAVRICQLIINDINISRGNCAKKRVGVIRDIGSPKVMVVVIVLEIVVTLVHGQLVEIGHARMRVCQLNRQLVGVEIVPIRSINRFV